MSVIDLSGDRACIMVRERGKKRWWYAAPDGSFVGNRMRAAFLARSAAEKQAAEDTRLNPEYEFKVVK